MLNKILQNHTKWIRENNEFTPGKISVSTQKEIFGDDTIPLSYAYNSAIEKLKKLLGLDLDIGAIVILNGLLSETEFESFYGKEFVIRSIHKENQIVFLDIIQEKDEDNIPTEKLEQFRMYPWRFKEIEFVKKPS